MITPAPLPLNPRAGPVAWLPVVLLLHGCALAGGHATPPPPPGESPGGWSEVGMASWYGHPYHGRATASGEVYDMEAPTGAHRTLPFGTRLRVENLDNGRSTTLTINDRGPFAKERILDVSRRVAEELGMLGPGTARVRITILEVHQPHAQIEDGISNFGSRTRAETFGEEVP
jgi:rare lipoprotein A (peptidoglycan hydrolase)